MGVREVGRAGQEVVVREDFFDSLFVAPVEENLDRIPQGEIGVDIIDFRRLEMQRYREIRIFIGQSMLFVKMGQG